MTESAPNTLELMGKGAHAEKDRAGDRPGTNEGMQQIGGCTTTSGADADSNSAHINSQSEAAHTPVNLQGGLRGEIIRTKSNNASKARDAPRT